MVVAIGLLVIAIVIFLMLPYWMSNEQGKAYVLSRLNRRINGTVGVGSWKLGWFSGTEIQDLTLALPDGKVVLTCPRLQTELTLWSLLWGNFDLGNTRLDSPNVMAAKYADGSNDLSRLMLTREGATGANPLKTLSGYIVCKNGFLELKGPGGGTPLLISEISAEIPIASRSAPMHLRADGMTAGTGGAERVEVTADLPSPSSWETNPYALLLAIQLRAANVPTGTLAEWMGLDRAWEQSLGPVLSRLTVRSEPEPGTGMSVISATATGTGGSIQARVRVETGPGGKAQISLVDQKDPSLVASLKLSPPLKQLLAHVNPVLESVTRMDDVVDVASNKLRVDLQDPVGASGQLYMRLPGMTLETSGLFRQVLVHTGDQLDQMAEQKVSVAPINLVLSGGRTECRAMAMTLESTRQVLKFSGSVGFDSTLDLVVSTSVPRALGAWSVQIPIGGTTDAPVLKVAGR
jgi:hypothetical protein